MKIVPVYVGSYINRQHFRLRLQMKIVPVYVGSYVNRQHFRLRFFVPLAVVTLQAFTRGKSFYLGKIYLGKFTSGFIFPRLKGHTGDHWTLGG